MKTQLTHLDLFSGIGGFALGFQWTGGFRTIGFCEIEPYCQKLLKQNFPGVPVYPDITKMDFSTIQADVITGGFPCQDISNAGRMKGIEGERSGLWTELHRAISAIRPRYAVLENVSALTVRGLDTVLSDLAEIGYDAEWHCVPASAIGAPHVRDRIWILAHSNGIRCRQGWKNMAGKRPESIKSTDTQSEILANTDSKRLERWPETGNAGIIGTRFFEYAERCSDRNRAHWAVEPAVGRVVNGIPRRVDRIKGLGNAIVPQMAQIIGAIILDHNRSAISDADAL